MEKTPNIVDISGNAFNQESPPQEAAADLGALNLEINRLKQRYRKYTKRMLDKAIEKPDQPKKPHLTIVK